MIKITHATKADVAAIYEMNLLFGNNASEESIARSLAEEYDQIVAIASVDGIAAGFASGRVVKSICYEDHRGDIEALFVREEYRHQGIGKALMLFMEAAFVDRGIEHLHICVMKANDTAYGLYTGLGFQDNGELLLEKDTI